MALGEMTPGKLKILKAVALLLEDPSAKITINQISKVVQVTEAAIYRHYRSKDEIFTSLLGYMESNFMTPLASSQALAGNTEEKLRTVFTKYMDFLEGHPGLARLFLGHGATEAIGMAERIKMLHAKIRAQVVQMVRVAQSKNELAIGLEPEQITELFYGMIVASAMAQTFAFPQIETANRWRAFVTTTFAPSASRAA